MFMRIVAVGLFSILILFSNSSAQTSKTFGIGIAILDLEQLVVMSTSDGYGANATITIPYLLSPGFRLEPEIGYFTVKQKAIIDGDEIAESATSFTFGVGIFPQKIYDGFTLYYGGRIGYMSQKLRAEEPGDTDEATSSGLYLAPAIGGEYHFSNHFSLGAEAQILYSTLTNEADGRTYDIDITLFSTRALVFFRFYF